MSSQDCDVMYARRMTSRHAVSETRQTRLATRAEVAAYLGVPVTTLAQWAYKHTGPRHIKIGRHTRYDWADVDRWIGERAAGGAA